MAGLTETKKNKNVEVYTKNSSGEVRRSGAFTPDKGIVTGKQIGRASCRERVSSPV